MRAKITRQSKNIGFGYTAGAVQGDTGLYVPLPDHQYHTGTVKSILRDLEKDANYQSLKGGGTVYNTAWFVKVNKVWYRVIKEQAKHPVDILESAPGMGYLYQSIELELEEFGISE